MQESTPKRRHGATRKPDRTPWPPVGYVTLAQFMAALGVRAPQTIYTYVEKGLIPAPDPIGPNRVGWRVERARKALDELPERVRRNEAQRTLTARRMAAKAEA
jgi:predicted DNA-binding transcriptional regulator AlpA